MNKQHEQKEVISLSHVYAGYEGEEVLEDISLSIYERDFVGIIGPNGGGKTSLLKVLLGLLTPYRGDVRILGKSATAGRQEIGYVPQFVQFDKGFPISARDVVRMGRLERKGLLHRLTADDEEIVQQSLARVHMSAQGERLMGDLSGGQRQRVFLARALACEPRILLLDEPTTSVDPEARTSIFEMLAELNREVTIIIVSHDVGIMSTHVKTIGCLNRYLFYHQDKELTPDMLEHAYQCPVDVIAHGMPHRVFEEHGGGS